MQNDTIRLNTSSEFHNVMLDFRLDRVCPHTESMKEVKQALPEFLFQKEREHVSVFETSPVGYLQGLTLKALKGVN